MSARSPSSTIAAKRAAAGALARESCNTLWIGGELGAVERACIRSVLRHERLTLWCYDLPRGVPEGVTVRDAGEIVPEREIVRYRSGSVALFANRFRYELQRLGHGIWVDTDVYLLKPIPRSEYLLAREPGVPTGLKSRLVSAVLGQSQFAAGGINNAVLRLPPDSPLIPPLLALFEQKTVPPWIPFHARAAAYWRLMRTGSTDLGRMPWGTAGPRALTTLVRRMDLEHLASPPEHFHPYDWAEAAWIADPARRLEDRATDATVGVHLWNERIKSFKNAPAPAGSFLARLQEEGA